jgi:cellulose synthase/poly-beta-1,6-N-acetylglucosamine synthase-like glycosyltransferase
MIAAILFFAAGFSVFYVLLGYPLLLEILARYFPKPICKQDHYESVSVIIPAYNEENSGWAKSLVSLAWIIQDLPKS